MVVTLFSRKVSHRFRRITETKKYIVLSLSGVSEKFSLCKCTHFNDSFQSFIVELLVFVSGGDSLRGSLMDLLDAALPVSREL